MKKYLIFLLIAMAFIGACKDKNAKPAAAAEEGDTAISAYAGTYNAIMPCKDCEGVDTELALNPDGTFTLIEFYLSQESELNLTEGVWEISPDATFIILTVAEAGQKPRKLFYGRKGIDLVKLDAKAMLPENGGADFILRRK